jgi:hypothetical protein
MSGNSRLASLRGPTTVAVHDDGDVPRETIPRNHRKQPLVATARLDNIFEIREH